MTYKSIMGTKREQKNLFPRIQPIFYKRLFCIDIRLAKARVASSNLVSRFRFIPLEIGGFLLYSEIRMQSRRREYTPKPLARSALACGYIPS